jgi:hypothetical protein
LGEIADKTKMRVIASTDSDFMPLKKGSLLCSSFSVASQTNGMQRSPLKALEDFRISMACGLISQQ